MFRWLKNLKKRLKPPVRKDAGQDARAADAKQREERTVSNVADLNDRFNRARYMDQDETRNG